MCFSHHDRKQASIRSRAESRAKHGLAYHIIFYHIRAPGHKDPERRRFRGVFRGLAALGVYYLYIKVSYSVDVK